MRQPRPGEPQPSDLSGTVEQVAEIRRLIEESEVVAQPPAPEWTDWISYLGSRFLEAIAEAIGGSLGGVALFARVLAVGLLVLLLVLLTMALLRALRGRGTRRATVDSEPRVRSADRRPVATPAASSIDELLARGEVPAALRAVWVWLTDRLSRGAGDATSWTGRRIVRQAGREDLLSLVADLERVSYGPGVVTRDRVEALWERVQRSVPGQTPGGEPSHSVNGGRE